MISRLLLSSSLALVAPPLSALLPSIALVVAIEGSQYPTMPGLDPTPYSAWGVLGILAVVILVLIGIQWRLFNRQDQRSESQIRAFMDFMDRHRAETTSALSGMANALTTSQDKLGLTLDTSLSKLSDVVRIEMQRVENKELTSRVLREVGAMKRRGEQLDETSIEMVVQKILDRK